MENYLKLIKNSSLLKTIPEIEILGFIKSGSFKIVTYEKNRVIHFDGDKCNRIEIILSGKIIIERIEISGEYLTITEFYQYDILGGNLIFSKNPYYPMTIIAQEPSLLLSISKELIFELCCSNHSLLKSYLEYISDNTLLLGEKLKHYINRTIRESLIYFLKHEYKKQNTIKLKLSLSKKSLAEKIGVKRTSLSRELQKMRNEGLIDFDPKSITILNTSILS